MIRLTHQPWLRFMAVLCATAVLALLPLSAGAAVHVAINNGGGGDTQGDPIDTNDFGSGGSGGGGHGDITNSFAVQVADPGVVIGKWTVLLVPDTILGVTVFSFVIIDNDASVGEAWYAQ